MFWEEPIEEGWSRKSVIWLSGVRRAGKTTLRHDLPSADYGSFAVHGGLAGSITVLPHRDRDISGLHDPGRGDLAVKRNALQQPLPIRPWGAVVQDGQEAARLGEVCRVTGQLEQAEARA